MSKKITFSWDDREYTLEYTRATASEIEKSGLNINEIDSKPNTMIPLLFRGAFLKHHRFVKPEKIDEIFDAMGDKQGLIGKLADMYADTIVSLTAEPEEAQGKNVNWGANW